MYDLTMTSITAKKIKGHTYYYARQSKRINGKPKIVWQKYLGRADDILTAIQQPPKPENAFVHEFGASAALYHIADQLNLVDLFDQHVPKRSAAVSVGTYMLIAVINRCLAPCSKNSIAHWYNTTALARITGVDAKQLTSQRFWDNMDRISGDALVDIERDIVARMLHCFQPDVSKLLFDATNFFTYINSFNQRSTLAQRGHSKEGRKSLRIVGLALLAACDHHLPLLHHTYPGNQPDSPTFRSLIDALVARFYDIADTVSAQVTLVFDKGNNCADNLAAITDSPYHVIGSLVPSHHPDLLTTPARLFKTLDDLPGVSTWRTTKTVYDMPLTIVVANNRKLKDAQTATLLREIAKCRQKLRQLQVNLQRRQKGILRKGRTPTLDSVRRQADGCLKAQHMKQLFKVSVQNTADNIPNLRYRFDQHAWKRLQSARLGKNLIFTTHTDWSDADIVRGYRAQHHVERAFRDLKDTQHISIRPQYHWTDHKIKVHVFCCVLALMMQTSLHRQITAQGLHLSCQQMLNELAAIKEVGVVYPTTKKHPKIEMTLSALSAIQKSLYDTFELERYRTS